MCKFCDIRRDTSSCAGKWIRDNFVLTDLNIK